MACPYCDVCSGGKAVGVASSALAPISIAYCLTCLGRGAEPLWLWHTTFDLCGGPDGVRAELIDGAASWVDGGYIDRDEIVARYQPQDIEEDTDAVATD